MSIAGGDILLSDSKLQPDPPEKLSPLQLLERYRYQGYVSRRFREKVLALVSKGVPPRTALRGQGLAPSTVNLWTQLAQDEQNMDRRAVLWRELQQAEQECIGRVAGNATALTEKDGRVALDYLGRRDPEHWRREDTLNVEVDVGVRIAGIVNEVIARSAPWEQIEGGTDELQGPREAEGIPAGEAEEVPGET